MKFSTGPTQDHPFCCPFQSPLKLKKAVKFVDLFRVQLCLFRVSKKEQRPT